jgi:acetoin utilization protein AcuC
MGTGPLLVFGPRSATYDFGPSHPLTPRRFGPGIDLLRAMGAEPGLAPEPATDEELLAVHTRRYIHAVRRLSGDPSAYPEAGIGPGDDPPFEGMHEAAASVAGGSLRAVEAILRGDVDHAFHPGGGLHHAMPDRASGFCIYDDPALAIARARAAGLRVLYVDLDVHHGDGVQAIHAADPGVLTVSIHESGRYLFPGTGAASEIGSGPAAGTVVNVPLEPMTGERAWLDAVEALVPPLAASFGPDLVVSQHGADSHAWDPLAHLRVTTTAMGAAARVVDAVAHREAHGRWLATGGGGYDAYRVVPRAWALTWLAGAHLEHPDETPPTWRERWAAEAGRHGQAPLPIRFADEPNAGLTYGEGPAAADRRSAETVRLVRAVVVPALLREAVARGWWSPSIPGASSGSASRGSSPAAGTPTLVGPLDRAPLERIHLAPRVIAPARPEAAAELLAAAAERGASIVGAVVGDTLVAAAVVAPDPAAAVVASDPAAARLLTVGVAPDYRGVGLGTAVLRRAVAATEGTHRPIDALFTVAERDTVEPEDVRVRRAIAERLLAASGFRTVTAPAGIAALDPHSVAGRLER